jgi:hypothetical protein
MIAKHPPKKNDSDKVSATKENDCGNTNQHRWIDQCEEELAHTQA